MDKDTAFSKWYGKNKDEYNARRRERYRKDAEYRKKVLDQSKKARGDSKIPPHLVTIGVVSEKIGRDPYTIKSWEVKGYTPIAPKIGLVRVYKKHQIDLLLLLVGFLSTHHHLKPGYQGELKKITSVVWEHW